MSNRIEIRIRILGLNNVYICYSSVKYKSTLLNCSIKIIKSAPKQKRYKSVSCNYPKSLENKTTTKLRQCVLLTYFY